MIANQHDVTLIVEDAVEQLDAAGAVSRTEALTLLRDESQRLLGIMEGSEEVIEIDENGVVHAVGRTPRQLKSTVLRDPEME